MIIITDELQIPDSELTFRYARSSGPGGQNVNKVATKVTLLFDVDASPSMTPTQKDVIRSRLGNRISREGILHVTSQRHRTRSANQRDVEQRFVVLLTEALQERRPRKKSRVPAAAKKRRLEDKRRRSAVKALRSRPSADE
jgi:ribosome-associated protein